MRVFFLSLVYFILQASLSWAGQNTCASDTSKYECGGSDCKIVECLPDQVCGYLYGDSAKKPECFYPKENSFTSLCGNNGTQYFLWQEKQRLKQNEKVSPKTFYQEKKCSLSQPVCEMQEKKAVCVAAPLNVNEMELCLDSSPVSNPTKIKEYQNHPLLYKVPDESVLKGGKVRVVKGGVTLKDSPDQCKTGTNILIEQACMNGKPVTAIVDCKQVGGPTAKCDLNNENQAYCKMDLNLLKDDDKDGIVNGLDNCLQISNASQKDSDKDNMGDACDNCPFVANSDQANSDGDLIGDVCDLCASISNKSSGDFDRDGFGDECDNCIFHFNSNQKKTNPGNLGDACFQTEAVDVQVLKNNNPGFISDNVSGAFNEPQQVCALTPAGDLKCWGKGPKFNGGPQYPFYSPEPVWDWAKIKQFSLLNHGEGCFISVEGIVYCWGTSGVVGGLLGPPGVYAGVNLPTKFPQLSNAKKLKYTGKDLCVLFEDFTMKCMGETNFELSPKFEKNILRTIDPKKFGDLGNGVVDSRIYDFDLKGDQLLMLYLTDRPVLNYKFDYCYNAVIAGRGDFIPLQNSCYAGNTDLSFSDYSLYYILGVPVGAHSAQLFHRFSNHYGTVLAFSDFNPFPFSTVNPLIDGKPYVAEHWQQMDFINANSYEACALPHEDYVNWGKVLPSKLLCYVGDNSLETSSQAVLNFMGKQYLPTDTYGIYYRTEDRPIFPGIPSIDPFDIAVLSTGNNFRCAISKVEGKVYCWGDNSNGQCGVDPALQPTVNPSSPNYVDLK